MVERMTCRCRHNRLELAYCFSEPEGCWDNRCPEDHYDSLDFPVFAYDDLISISRVVGIKNGINIAFVGMSVRGISMMPLKGNKIYHLKICLLDIKIIFDWLFLINSGHRKTLKMIDSKEYVVPYLIYLCVSF